MWSQLEFFRIKSKCQTIYTDSETSPGNWSTTQSLNQPVVASTRGYRALRTDPSRYHLEGCPRVVIQSPHQARIDLVENARVGQQVTNRVEMCPAGITEKVDALRGRGC